MTAGEARQAIRAGALPGPAFHELLLSVPARDRDAWFDALLGLAEAPGDVPDLPPGAVPYLPAGVEEILAAIREGPIGSNDRFVDLGSGLGRVALLVHLITGARAHGIELQPALVRLAREAAAALGLGAVSFEQANAAGVDLDGSVFFLYAPFNGAQLEGVLGRLEAAARRRPLLLCAVHLELPAVRWLSRRESSNPALTFYDSR